MIKKKKCTKCGEVKLLIEFYKNKNHKDGLQYICKRCANQKSKEYRHSKEGLITKIYGNQRDH